MAAPCTDMAKHLFLTGDKQVGKSTLIRRLLEHERRKIGGFYTVKTDQVFPGCSSVHLLRIGVGEEPSEENFLFRCDSPEDEMVSGHFNQLGCAAIKASKDAELLIMDELGPKETQAEEFQKAVLQMLDGDIPVLGVLQKADTDFLQQIATCPKVRIFEVTERNRDDMEFWRGLMNDSATIV